MTCDKTYDLVAYHNNAMTADERSAIATHLATCGDCQQDLARIRETIAALKSMPEVTPSAGFAERVTARARLLIRTEAQPAPMTLWDYLKLSLRYSPPWAISVAVHLIIFAGLSVLFIKPAIEKQTEILCAKLEQTLPLPLPSNEIVIPDYANGKISRAEPQLTQPESAWSEKGLDISSERDARLIQHLSQRSNPEFRRALRERYNATDTAPAVNAGLKWLATTQSASGTWNNNDKHGGLKEYEVAVTGLSMLAFLAEGNSHQSGDYTDVVNKGVRYLLASQTDDGVYGPKQIASPFGEAHHQKQINYMYNHAIATAALIEDYLMTSDTTDPSPVQGGHTTPLRGGLPLREQLAKSIKQAINFTARAQHKKGGWGYTADNQPDTSVTVWQAYALKLAQLANIDGAQEALARTWDWWRYVTNEQGLVGYDAPGSYPNGPYALTAAAMFCRIFANQATDELADQQAKSLSSALPIRDGQEKDYYRRFWTTSAMFLKGGDEWANWDKHARGMLLTAQATDNGSWSTDDRWGEYGGQAYTTAMAVLTLQSCYRYPSL